MDKLTWSCPNADRPGVLYTPILKKKGGFFDNDNLSSTNSCIWRHIVHEEHRTVARSNALRRSRGLATSHTKLAQTVADMIFDRLELGLEEWCLLECTVLTKNCKFGYTCSVLPYVHIRMWQKQTQKYLTSPFSLAEINSNIS